MDYGRLKEVLSAFADDPTALHFERGNVMIQIQNEVIHARLHQRDGLIYVEEEGVEQVAEKWIASRIAQLGNLAYSITQMIPSCESFITSPAHLLDQLEFANSDTPVEVPDALACLKRTLERRAAGMCSVLYLTSDAGEGKTTLINQLALEQAERYRDRTSDWLLVPIGLGGSPFLRLDNVIAAALLNQLRFRRLYFEAFIQLVRLGFIVLALDGFEEVFVETAGDAVSSLGTLIGELKGEGTLLVAARTAYFDFRRLDRQARLVDAIPGFDVGFGKLSLDRWRKREFIDICSKNDVLDAEGLYDELVVKLGQEHPLLTRAVFVKRMVDLANVDATLSFIPHTEDATDLFHPFIDTILQREIEHKWIDKSSEVATPLLSITEHYGLLELMAEEMWLSKRTALPADTCDSLADIFCEAHKKSPAVSRQVRERLTNHALLVSDSTHIQVGFDHDHFREFFLGELTGQYILNKSQPDLRKLLRVDALPHFSLDIAVSYCMTKASDNEELIKVIQEIATTDGPASFVRENSGALVVRFLARSNSDRPYLAVSDLNFPPDSLTSRRVANVTFMNSYFQSTEITSEVIDTDFLKCEFEHLEIAAHLRLTRVNFTDCQVRALTLIKGDGTSAEYFDPRLIKSLLIRHGASILSKDTVVIEAEEVADDDEGISFVRKLLTIFGRSLVVGERVLSVKFGVHWSSFFGDYLPRLLEARIVEEVPHRGGGYQRNFRLSLPFAETSAALAASNGSFSQFLSAASTD
jgi:hypothetical protein